MATIAQTVRNTVEVEPLVTTRGHWMLLTLAFATAYLGVRLFRGLSPLLLGGDQVFFWSYGQRVAHGQLPYRDFFQITGPATDWIFAATFRVFGESVFATDLVVLALGVALALAVFQLCRAFASPGLAAAISALYLLKIYSRFLSATHHFFSMLAISVGLLCLFGARSRLRLFSSGLCLGLACVVTQTHGAMAILVISDLLLLERQSTLLKRVKDCAVFFSGALAVVAPVELLLAMRVGFHQLWYCQVTVPSRWPSSGASSAWWLGSDHSLRSSIALVLAYSFVPAIYALTAWRGLRRDNFDRRALLLLAVGAVLLVEVWMAPNQLRYLAAALPAFPLLGYLARESSHRVVPVAWGIVLALTFSGIGTSRMEPVAHINTPGGRIVATPSAAEKLDWLQANLKPDDRVFEVAYPGVYVPLRRLDPLYADNLMPVPLSPAEVVERTTDELRAHSVQYIVWNRALAAPPPRETRAAFDHFRQFVSDHYTVVKVLSDDEEILKLRTEK